MDKKKFIRKKFFLKRKIKYFEIKENFFYPLIRLIKKKSIKKRLNIAIYYPSSFEVNILKILEIDYFKKFNFLLPVIEKNSMNFYKWKKNDVLLLNKYGIPEPTKSSRVKPDIILVPLLAYDKSKNRLGYGKGFYDMYLHKNAKMRFKILAVGIAFYFQQHSKLPFNNKDFRLDNIITDKGIL